MLKEIIVIICVIGVCSAGIIVIPLEKVAAPDLDVAESAQIGYGAFNNPGLVRPGYGGYGVAPAYGALPGYGAYGGQEVVEGSIGIPGLGGVTAEFGAGNLGGGIII